MIDMKITKRCLVNFHLATYILFFSTMLWNKWILLYEWKYLYFLLAFVGIYALFQLPGAHMALLIWIAGWCIKDFKQTKNIGALIFTFCLLIGCACLNVLAMQRYNVW